MRLIYNVRAEASHHKALRMHAPATHNKKWRFETVATRLGVGNVLLFLPILEFDHERGGEVLRR